VAANPIPLPTLADLTTLIDTVLDSINATSAVYLNRSTVDAAYAGYIFGLVLAAVERIADPNSIVLRSIQTLQQQTSPTTFIIRGSPGPIYSSTQDFGFARFTYKTVDYEVHLGVQYRGTSGVLHEFDVSILPAATAQDCRDNNKAPGSARASAIFECKCYSNNLGIELGREFVGLKADFSSVQMARLVTNADSQNVSLFLRGNSRPKMSALLAPQNAGMEQEFVHAIADELRNSL
jgi:hypothetical protein